MLADRRGLLTIQSKTELFRAAFVFGNTCVARVVALVVAGATMPEGAEAAVMDGAATAASARVVGMAHYDVLRSKFVSARHWERAGLLVSQLSVAAT